MSALTNYTENKLLDHLLRVQAFPVPTGLFLALFTSAPGEGGGGTEVSGGGYARVAVTFGAATAGSAFTTATIQFPKATANWGSITHYALFDASTGGNMLLYGSFNPAVQVNSGDTLTIPVNGLSVSAD